MKTNKVKNTKKPAIMVFYVRELREERGLKAETVTIQ